MNLTPIARPYAKAAFEFSQAAGHIAQWLDFLQQAAQLVEQEEMAALIANPNVGSDKVAELMIELLAISDSAQQNLLHLLAESHRLSALSCVFVEFEKLKEAEEKKMQVEVVSAKSLSDKQLSEITHALTKKFEREVSVHAHVDESLLGGAIVKAGDLVIDGSIEGRLNQLREHLKGEQL